MTTTSEVYLMINDRGAPWSDKEMRLVTFLNFIATPEIAHLTFTVFIILFIVVAYFIMGVILFTLFGNR